MWGGAPPGTVRSLPVGTENRKEVVIPSVHVQHEYSHDEEFLYGRLLCSKICVVKNTWTKDGFSTGKEEKKKTAAVPCAVFFYRGSEVFSSFRMGNGHFRIDTLLVLLSQILNLTMSDLRQHGQTFPFTTSSLRKVHGMRNCRAYIVAETEKPYLMEHERLYPLLFAF